MNYYDVTSKIFGFPTSRWEDKVTATKIRGSSTLTKTLLRGCSKSGLIVLISIVFLCVFHWNIYDICLQLYFQLFIAEHAGLLPKCLAFPVSWKSMW